MTLPCWAILEILPRNADFIMNLIFPYNLWEYAQSTVVGLRSWGCVCIGCRLFVKVMGVVPSMHLCHSLALAVTLPLMMTNDKVDFRHNQHSHHFHFCIYVWHRRCLGGEQNYWWCHWPIWQQRPLPWWWQMTKCSNSYVDIQEKGELCTNSGTSVCYATPMLLFTHYQC